MSETLPEAAPQGLDQVFKLVDATTAAQGGGSCGCGGHGHGHGAAAPAAAPEAEPQEAPAVKDGGCGCGCGGHGAQATAAAPAAEAPVAVETTQKRAGGGCGCGGHGHGHGHGDQVAAAQAPSGGGCGCGGHGHGSHSHPQGQGVRHMPSDDELVVHSIPAVLRPALLFAAMDLLPLGAQLTVVTPHQPDRLFEYLQNSESHYRVETLEAGPVDWRYRVTRLS